MFEPKTGTPEQQSAQQKVRDDAAAKKQKDQQDKKKTALKKEGENIYQLSQQLAKQIPGQSGMTVDDFKNKWIPGFEQGYVQYTPDTKDTPYDLPYGNRPKVKIIQEGTNNTTSTSKT